MSLQSAIQQAVNKLLARSIDAGVKAVTNKSKSFSFETLPRNVEELKKINGMSMTDEFSVAAMCVLAMNRYPENKEDCFSMLEYLNGPENFSPRDQQFIRDRFMDGRDYMPRSYFEGAKPQNNYTPKQPYTLTIREGAHSRDTEGYVKLFITSGGADSDRYVMMRKKPSTGEWFIWEYMDLLASMRIPVKDDKWA